MMFNLVKSAFALFLIQGALGETEIKGKVVEVDLYYESLCGDSIKFVRDQLVPTYPKLKDNLKINFIPYGKASHEKKAGSDKWTFQCQHGPNECFGNKAQACGLAAIAEHENSIDQQNLSVKLIGCTMASAQPDSAVPLCAKEAGLKDESKTFISACIQGSQGDELLVGHGDKTHKLEPKLAFVPTVVVGGVFTSTNQAAALANFQSFICSLQPKDNKPAACS